MPPDAAGERGDRRFLQVGVDRRLHRRAGRGSDSARIRAVPVSSATASSVPPGLPARRVLKACSRPLIPTGVPGGKPGARAPLVVVHRRLPTSPVTSIAELPRGGRGPRPAPSASGVPSGARIGARGASSIWPRGARPRAQAGEDEARVPGDAAVGEGQVELGFDWPKATVSSVDRHRDHGGPVARGVAGASRGRSSAGSPLLASR